MEGQEYVRQGEVRTLTGKAAAAPGETYQITGTPTHTLFDSAGTAVAGHDDAPVSGNDTAAGQEVAAWVSLGGLTPGEYRLVFSIPATSDLTSLTDTFRPALAVEVVAVPSTFDRWIMEMQRVVRDLVPDDAADRLAYRQYRSALAAAVLEYSRTWPRLLRAVVPLTANQWEYGFSTLTAGQDPAAAWVPGLSELLAVNPRYDAAVQSVPWLDVGLQVTADAGREVWRFRCGLPSTGQVADLRWTTVHSLTEGGSTLPPGPDGLALHFEALCQWAAGWLLLGPLASEAAMTNDPQSEMAVVSYRDMTQRRAAQGAALQKAAVLAWKGRQPLQF